ncbi:MAG: hypothetical protein BMS9Abin37_2793 [Acidobacteriota bacterium]|nr:MAG: hypothetical protein BMS9Abin37_2793 [Acidobacteriota bacterium]
MGLGSWDLRGTDCAHAVREALDIGYRHLDMAQMYANQRWEKCGIGSKRWGVLSFILSLGVVGKLADIPQHRFDLFVSKPAAVLT